MENPSALIWLIQSWNVWRSQAWQWCFPKIQPVLTSSGTSHVFHSVYLLPKKIKNNVFFFNEWSFFHCSNKYAIHFHGHREWKKECCVQSVKKIWRKSIGITITLNDDNDNKDDDCRYLLRSHRRRRRCAPLKMNYVRLLFSLCKNA